MVGITDLGTFVLGTVAIILLPGPNSLFVLAVAARQGVAAGYRAASGIFLGDTVLMTLSAAGVASLLKAYPPLYLTIKWAGAAYLAYLGFGMVRDAWRRWRGHHPERAKAPQDSDPVRHPFRRAALISLLNPKAILFFVSFFIQFVDPAYPYPALSFLVLGAVVQLVSAIYLSVLIFTGTFFAAQFRRRRRLAAGLTTAVGALFLGFGLKLATS
ncbi:MAG TPA: leucine efflux protein LeuE [Micromonospora sp.]